VDTSAIRLALALRRGNIFGAHLANLVELAHVVEAPAHRSREVGVRNRLWREMGKGPEGLGVTLGVGGDAEQAPGAADRHHEQVAAGAGGDVVECGRQAVKR
jgi:hypothetical protein